MNPQPSNSAHVAARVGRGLVALASDLRLGARSLRRSPGFATLSIAILGVGIGAATLAYALIHAVLLNPLPYDRPEQVYQLELVRGGGDGTHTETVVPKVVYHAWEVDGTRVARVAASDEARRGTTMYLSGGVSPERIRGAFVSPAWFAVLGARAGLGRVFGADDDGQPVAVISHDLWARTFGADPQAIGRELSVNGAAYTVIGVLPAGFVPPPPVWRVASTENIDLWAPLRAGGTPLVQSADHDRVIVRVLAGSSREAAESTLFHIAAAVWPYPNPLVGVRLTPMREEVAGRARTALTILASVVALLLLLTCANVAGIQLARFSRRAQEAAIRIALGASRARVFAHFLAEGLVLAVPGCVLGLVAALWGREILRVLAPASLPRLDTVGVGGPVVTFTIAAALLAALAATVVPAVSVAATGRTVTKRAPVSARAPRTARDALVVAQVVIAVALLAGTGLLVRSMLRLRSVDPGFTHLDVTMLDLHRRVDALGVPVQSDGFFEEVLRQVRNIPGVEAATFVSSVPFRPRDYYGQGWRRRMVGTGYFAMLGIPLEAGRAFDSRDRAESEPVAIISRSLATREFPDRDPLGATIDDQYTVVGIVGDVHHEALDSPPQPALYVPLAQVDENRLSLLVRSSLPTDAVAKATRQVVRSIDPQQPIGSVATLRQLLEGSDAVSRRRFELRVLLAVGAFALLLAALGVYGVVAQAVVLRTPEIGVRVTLGATHRDIALLVLSGVGRLVAIGTAGGVVGALVLSRVLRSALFAVAPADPLSLLAAAATLAAAALLAAALPARRAMAIDPARALRDE